MRAESGRIVRYCIRHHERSTSRCIVINPSISAINTLTTSPLVNSTFLLAHRSRSALCSVAEGPLYSNEKEGNTCLLIFTIPCFVKDFPKRDNKRASAAAWAHRGVHQPNHGLFHGDRRFRFHQIAYSIMGLPLRDTHTPFF